MKKILLHWHRKLGHCSLRYIRRLVTANIDLNLPSQLTPGELQLPVCIKSKSIRLKKFSGSERIIMETIGRARSILTLWESLGLCFCQPQR
ncbi:uncharacterized protein VP01_2860g2 [Puccinia sorghi]|uniref:GAG-pre-integrase domain-containing protein n=1 Tax=Puccinia sorghi TaxID=27349 RepID=A0A0L6V1W9_9BASI|nr:uncharacterized protein VP01_2860g2 [Puccinia sorghi]